MRNLINLSIGPPGARRQGWQRRKPLDYSGPITYRQVPGSAMPRDELVALDDLAFDGRYGGQHDLPHARRGRLVEARVGAVLGGYALGLPLLGVPEEGEPEWFIDTVAVAPALQGRAIGKRLVGLLARWLDAEGVERLAGTPLVGSDRARREAWMRSLGFHDGDHGLISSTAALARWAEEGA